MKGQIKILNGGFRLDVATTPFFALLLCRSLYDTKGGLWAWLMHAGADVIIFAVVLFRVG
jgi:hypothetical protein